MTPLTGPTCNPALTIGGAARRGVPPLATLCTDLKTGAPARRAARARATTAGV